MNDTVGVDQHRLGEEPLLELTEVSASVEGFEVTREIDLTVQPGEAVGLVGRNGAGKTTTFRSIMGLTPVERGSIRLRDADVIAGLAEADPDAVAEQLRHEGTAELAVDGETVTVTDEMLEMENGSIWYPGEELTDLRAELIPKRGIGYQPEDRDLFTGMTVEENLRLPIWVSGEERGIEDEDAVLADIYDLFDEVEDRRHANVENLSGGEGKMTAIGRALALEPDLVLLDEPLEGLAPVVVENLKSHLREILELDISLLIAESNVSHVPEIIDRMYVIERGEIVATGDPHELAKDEEIQRLLQG